MIRKGSIPYRMIAGAGLVLIRAFEWMIRRQSGDRVFYESREFPWTSRVEAGWKDIRQELEQVLAAPRPVPSFESVSEEQARIVQPEHWKTFFFYAYGHRVDDGCARCPKTVALLDSIPGMTTAMFSILTPGTRIAPHRGPFKGVLRYHLALIVPADGERCAIRVGGEGRRWREGEGLVFDDTYEHEAWNETDEVRGVLFVDFLRKLPFPLSALNRGMIHLIGASPFVQNMVENLNRMNGRIADAPLPLAS
jgi:ornithine lipid ester-linked acyl 2-hydroxylase